MFIVVFIKLVYEISDETDDAKYCLFASRFISVMIRAISLMTLYTDWFYLFNTAFSGLGLVLGLERLSSVLCSASKICLCPGPGPQRFGFGLSLENLSSLNITRSRCGCVVFPFGHMLLLNTSG